MDARSACGTYARASWRPPPQRPRSRRLLSCSVGPWPPVAAGRGRRLPGGAGRGRRHADRSAAGDDDEPSRSGGAKASAGRSTDRADAGRRGAGRVGPRGRRPRRAGRGPPPLLGLQPRNLAARRPPAARAGLRVVLYDQRGHGASTRGTAPLAIETLAHDLAAGARGHRRARRRAGRALHGRHDDHVAGHAPARGPEGTGQGDGARARRPRPGRRPQAARRRRYRLAGGHPGDALGERPPLRARRFRANPRALPRGSDPRPLRRLRRHRAGRLPRRRWRRWICWRASPIEVPTTVMVGSTRHLDRARRRRIRSWRPFPGRDSSPCRTGGTCCRSKTPTR